MADRFRFCSCLLARLMVAPRSGLIVVVFAGNYNQLDARKLPVRVITEFALPAIRDR